MIRYKIEFKSPIKVHANSTGNFDLFIATSGLEHQHQS